MKSTLSDNKICEIVGITRQQHRALAKRGLARLSPHSGASIKDCLNLAALVKLMERLTPQEIAVAWPQLESALSSALPGQRFDVVFDSALGQIHIARSSDELRQIIIALRTPRVIDLGEHLAEIADAFRRWSEAISATSKKRRSEKTRKNA